MNRTLHLAGAAFLGAILAAGSAGASGLSGEYIDVWVGVRLRHERPGSLWTDLVARPDRSMAAAGQGPRTWDPSDQNPWANTFGTPTENRWPTTTISPWRSGAVRMCSCYLPTDARSWDGGPLTSADIARLCRAQCY